MLEFELNYLKKIRIWLHNKQNLVLSDNNREAREYFTHSNQNFLNTTIIVELFIPRGGRNIYGLLGADYVALATDSLEVSISGGNTLKPKVFVDSLLEKTEQAYFYLPSEYRNSVFNKIESINSQNGLNLSGKLDFRYGAASEVASNEWVFSKLASLIISLLQIAKEDITADLLNSMLDN